MSAGRAGAALVAVVIITICISLLAGMDYSEPRPEWQYDDYKLIEDVASVDGSLELVEVGGVEYVHAKDLGPGTIHKGSGESVGVDVRKAQLDLFMMSGQSNAAYHLIDSAVLADPTTASPVPEPGMSYYYGRETRYDTLGQGGSFLPLLGDDGAPRVGDKLPAWAATYSEITGHKTYFVCTAISGTYIHQFLPDGGNVWSYMETNIQKAVEAVDTDLYELDVKGYMWIQGEFNRDTPIPEYKEQFLEMHYAILRGELGVKFDHCFISLVHFGNAIEAQRELAEEHPDTITIASEAALDFTTADYLPDGWHYNQLGDNIIGVDLGRGCAEWYDTRGDSPTMRIVEFIPVLLALAGLAFVVVSFIRRN